MLVDSNKLWVRVMKAKYSCALNTIPVFKHKVASTSTWKAIVNSWDLVENNVTWIVKNSHDIRFWKDCWTPGCETLFDILGDLCPIDEINFPVMHYEANGSWN